MKTLRPLLAGLSVACLALSAQIPAAVAADRSLTEFDADDIKKLGWSVVDDGVMGGRSKGKISFSESGKLRFSGNLSLENNGGFSSLRTGRLNLDLGGSEGFVMRVKGDGRTYQLRLGTDARYRLMEVSFMAEFETVNGEWSEVRVPFEKLVGSFRGRTLKDEVFNPAKIQRIGLLLADKKSGAFELEVDWIRTYATGGEPRSLVETAVADGRFKTLAAALEAAGLVEVLQGKEKLTVFAPTDQAFAKLPKGTLESLLQPGNKEKLQSILKYHVSAGASEVSDALKLATVPTVQGEPVRVAFSDGRVRINDAAVLDADIKCSNGIIHVIDSVLLPPEPARTTVLSVAKSAGTFNTLLAAINAAGLGQVLEGDGPFTILAPTDKAFAALPKGTVEKLLQKENREQLKAILTYHVVGGRVSAGDALGAKSAKTLNGQALSFAIRDGRFKVNEATITSVDIDGGNGVIHVIDAVLLPEAKSKVTQKPELEQAGNKAAAERIVAAVDKGVPIYNHGDHATCAKIYEACLQGLVDDGLVAGDVRSALTKVLDRTRKNRDANARAWIYRHSLNSVMEHLTGSSL